MKPILKHRIAEVFADMGIVDVDYQAGHATGGRYTRHEEGWTAEYATVEPLADGSFRVEYGTDGTDCDGRMSSGEETVIRKLARGHRFYMGPDTNPGRFHVKRFTRVKTERTYQRDYSAEAAGY